MSEEELRELFSERLDRLTHASAYGNDPANPKIAGAADYVKRAQRAYDEIANQLKA